VLSWSLPPEWTGNERVGEDGMRQTVAEHPAAQRQEQALLRRRKAGRVRRGVWLLPHGAFDEPVPPGLLEEVTLGSAHPIQRRGVVKPGNTQHLTP
jgi:hypothetical protein